MRVVHAISRHLISCSTLPSRAGRLSIRRNRKRGCVSLLRLWHSEASRLEQEPETKLKQSWFINLRTNHTEVCLIGLAAGCGRRAKHGFVKQVEEFSPELDPQSVVRSEAGGLIERKVKIVNALRAKDRINPALSAVSVGSRHAER